MSRLTRDATTAERISRDQIVRRERGQGNIQQFPCSADPEQDWRPYPVDPYSCYMCDDHTYIHFYIYIIYKYIYIIYKYIYIYIFIYVHTTDAQSKMFLCCCTIYDSEYRSNYYLKKNLNASRSSLLYYCPSVVVVVFFTLTDRASTIPSNIRGCQSGTWSQRGTKVNGSHHGDNPLLRPTGIQIATKSYATLQAMTPTNNKTVNQTFFTPYREQPRSTRIAVAYPRPAFSATNRTNTFQPVLINNYSKFLKATHRVQK